MKSIYNIQTNGTGNVANIYKIDYDDENNKLCGFNIIRKNISIASNPVILCFNKTTSKFLLFKHPTTGVFLTNYTLSQDTYKTINTILKANTPTSFIDPIPAINKNNLKLVGKIFYKIGVDGTYYNRVNSLYTYNSLYIFRIGGGINLGKLIGVNIKLNNDDVVSSDYIEYFSLPPVSEDVKINFYGKRFKDQLEETLVKINIFDHKTTTIGYIPLWSSSSATFIKLNERPDLQMTNPKLLITPINNNRYLSDINEFHIIGYSDDEKDVIYTHINKNDGYSLQNRIVFKDSVKYISHIKYPNFYIQNYTAPSLSSVLYYSGISNKNSDKFARSVVAFPLTDNALLEYENKDNLYDTSYDSYIYINDLPSNKRVSVAVRSCAPTGHKNIPSPFFIKTVKDSPPYNIFIKAADEIGGYDYKGYDGIKPMKMMSTENDKVFSDSIYQLYKDSIGRLNSFNYTIDENIILPKNFKDSRYVQRYKFVKAASRPDQERTELMRNINHMLFASIRVDGIVGNRKEIITFDETKYDNTVFPIKASKVNYFDPDYIYYDSNDNEYKYIKNNVYYQHLLLNHHSLNVNKINDLILPFADIYFRGFDEFLWETKNFDIVLPIYYDYFIMSKKDRMNSYLYTNQKYSNEYLNSLINFIYHNKKFKESKYIDYSQFLYIIRDNMVNDNDLEYKKFIGKEHLYLDKKNNVYSNTSSYGSYILKT